jgi:hypothetical protein
MGWADQAWIADTDPLRKTLHRVSVWRPAPEGQGFKEGGRDGASRDGRAPGPCAEVAPGNRARETAEAATMTSRNAQTISIPLLGQHPPRERERQIGLRAAFAMTVIITASPGRQAKYPDDAVLCHDRRAAHAAHDWPGCVRNPNAAVTVHSAGENHSPSSANSQASALASGRPNIVRPS